MRCVFLALLLVGCADGMTLSMNAPDPGAAHDGGSAGTTGAGGAGGGTGGAPACTAAVETLSGRGTFVAGSLAAADASDQNCVDWAAGNQAAVHDANVVSGAIDGHALAMMSATPAAGGCVYVLRETLGPLVPAVPCAVTADFSLTAP